MSRERIFTCWYYSDQTTNYELVLAYFAARKQAPNAYVTFNFTYIPGR